MRDASGPEWQAVSNAFAAQRRWQQSKRGLGPERGEERQVPIAPMAWGLVPTTAGVDTVGPSIPPEV